MSIDVTLLPKIPTPELAREISLLGVTLMRVLISELVLEEELRVFIPSNDSGRSIATDAKRELAELKKVRAEGMITLATLVNEYNVREDKPGELPIPQAVFSLMEA